MTPKNHRRSRTRSLERVRLPGGVFTMGSDAHYPEEAPPHRVRVDAFEIDPVPVTNDRFAAFVKATGYLTVAERPVDPADFPGAPPENLVPGSLVFTPTDGPVDLRHLSQWWTWTPGASWRHPEGPGSGLKERGDHPVVHVAHEDAATYAAWAGAALPTEAEWEYAARGGLEGQAFTWGDEARPDGRIMANTWDGLEFPWRSTGESGYLRTSPVGSFPANPRGGDLEASLDPRQPQFRVGRKVIKGGSHLCADTYCLRYRPAARRPQMIDTGMGHVGFRCVVRPAATTDVADEAAAHRGGTP